MSVSGKVAARISQSNPFNGGIVTAADVEKNLIFALPIAELALPVRVENGIRNTTARYVGELVQLSNFDFKGSSIGRLSFLQLQSKLKERRLGLSMQVDWPKDKGSLTDYLAKNSERAVKAEFGSTGLTFEPASMQTQSVDEFYCRPQKISTPAAKLHDVLTPRQMLLKKRGALNRE
jgi:hypothetical protein